MKRLLLFIVLGVAVVGAVSSTASAMAFDDSVCPSGAGTSDSPRICPQGSVGASYSLQFQIREGGGCPPYTFQIGSGALPPGLSLSSSGLVSGTPSTAGAYGFWLDAKDSPISGQCNLNCGPPGTLCTAFQKDTARFFLVNVVQGLDLEPSSVPVGTIGVSYSAKLTATPVGTQSFSVTAGALPPGLGLEPSTGLISGTPTTAGSYPFKVQVSDTDGRRISREYTINVANPITITTPPTLPTIRGQRSGRAEVGIDLSGTLAATGGNGTLAWTVAGGSLPTGITLGSDGAISGTPTVAGRYAFTAQAADVDGRTSTLNVQLTVAQRLAIKTFALKATKVGRLYNAKLKTLGGVAPLKWKIAGKLPRGIRFAKTLGVFSGTAKREGTYRVSVQVTDALGVTAKKTFILVVKA